VRTPSSCSGCKVRGATQCSNSAPGAQWPHSSCSSLNPRFRAASSRLPALPGSFSLTPLRTWADATLRILRLPATLDRAAFSIPPSLPFSLSCHPSHQSSLLLFHLLFISLKTKQPPSYTFHSLSPSNRPSTTNPTHSFRSVLIGREETTKEKKSSSQATTASQPTPPPPSRVQTTTRDTSQVSKANLPTKL
jgi:hypothetical protein